MNYKKYEYEEWIVAKGINNDVNIVFKENI